MIPVGRVRRRAGLQTPLRSSATYAWSTPALLVTISGARQFPSLEHESTPFEVVEVFAMPAGVGSCVAVANTCAEAIPLTSSVIETETIAPKAAVENFFMEQLRRSLFEEKVGEKSRT